MIASFVKQVEALEKMLKDLHDSLEIIRYKTNTLHTMMDAIKEQPKKEEEQPKKEEVKQEESDPEEEEEEEEPKEKPKRGRPPHLPFHSLLRIETDVDHQEYKYYWDRYEKIKMLSKQLCNHLSEENAEFKEAVIKAWGLINPKVLPKNSEAVFTHTILAYRNIDTFAERYSNTCPDYFTIWRELFSQANRLL